MVLVVLGNCGHIPGPRKAGWCEMEGSLGGNYPGGRAELLDYVCMLLDMVTDILFTCLFHFNIIYISKIFLLYVNQLSWSLQLT